MKEERKKLSLGPGQNFSFFFLWYVMPPHLWLRAICTSPGHQDYGMPHCAQYCPESFAGLPANVKVGSQKNNMEISPFLLQVVPPIGIHVMISKLPLPNASVI
jgi:hypothetical protein